MIRASSAAILAAMILAAPGSVAAKTFVALLPEAFDGDKPALMNGLGALAMNLMDGDRLLVLRGGGPSILAEVTPPTGPKASNPAWRRKQLAMALQPVAAFIRDNPGVSTDGTPPGSHMIPQEIHAVAQNLLSAADRAAGVDVLMLGAWSYLDPKDGRFAMLEGFYPSDGHFKVTPAESPFGTRGLETVLQGTRLHFCWPGGNAQLISEEYGEVLRRHWSLWAKLQGGSVATYSFDLATCLGRFGAGASGEQVSTQLSDETKLEMRRVRPPIPPAMPASTEQPGPYFMRDDAPISTTPPTTTTGIAWVGLKWLANADVDLYARAEHRDPWLFFGNARTESGFFNKDFLNGTGESQFEYIEFSRPIDLAKAEVTINLYSGELPEGPRGVIRVWFGGHIYEAPFTLKARSGNHGFPPMDGDAWLRIDLRKVVGLPGS